MGNLIVSKNGWNRLVMQTDQNLLIYADNYDGQNGDGPKATWATGKARSDAYLKLQGDGNACLYGGGKAKWCSNTVGKGSHHLKMNNGGNLCLYSSSGVPLWCSNTRTYGNSQYY